MNCLYVSQRCFNDMAAITLNYLPPHYYADVNEQKEIGSPWVMVETAVIEAIDRVSENQIIRTTACSMTVSPIHRHSVRQSFLKNILDNKRGNKV